MIPYTNLKKGFRYILQVIDVFSKFIWVEPIKRKQGKDVTSAMKKILSRISKIRKYFQTDIGKEFYNRNFKKLLESYNLHPFSSFSNLKASVVQRVNRTLKTLMWKHFSLQGSYKWLNILSDIVKKYNNQNHSTIRMEPSQVTTKKEKWLIENIYNANEEGIRINTRFSKGENVRISKYREAFSKGYTPNWSNKVFKIRKVHSTTPTRYLLKDQTGQDIQGSFYTEEFQKTPHSHLFNQESSKKKRK